MPHMNNVIKGSYINILDRYMGATEEAKEYGANFYDNAHNIATEIGYELDYKGWEATEVGSAIIAIFSPRTDWDANVTYAFEFIKDRWVDKQTEINNRKALAILSGEKPMDVLGKTAYKVKPFYKAILNPNEDNLVTNLHGFNKPVNLAVIDRHAGGVYFGKPLREYQRYYLGGWKVTRRISKAYFKVARILDMPVNVLQAIVWADFRDEFKHYKHNKQPLIESV